MHLPPARLHPRICDGFRQRLEITAPYRFADRPGRRYTLFGEQAASSLRTYLRTHMPQSTASSIGQIHALLANKRYSVNDLAENVLRVEEVESGISLRAVLEGDILFLSLVCLITPANSLTPTVLRKMLAADNGISTSHFQLYETGNGNVAVTLNNFCKLQELGPDDEDDILSCVSFLLADVVHAKQLIGADLHSA